MTTVLYSKHRRPSAWLAALLLLVAGGCGGGGGVAISDSGGIGGSGISFGVVTGFGSVIVNGKQFDTDDADIFVNDVAAGEADLSEGMLARIEGDWDAAGVGVASRVDYHDDIRGPFEGIDQFDELSGQGVMAVLGQTVSFNRQTVFRGFSPTMQSLDAIALRVSGWLQDDGVYVASLVRADGNFVNGDGVRLRGFIGAINDIETRFSIGALTVDYSGIAGFTPATGDYVSVTGPLTGGVLEAGGIDVLDAANRLRALPGDAVDLEGLLSGHDASARTFHIHGATVRINDQTVFRVPLTEAQLRNGLRIAVQGEWNDAGNLVAALIENRTPDSEIDAAILGIPGPANGILNVGGVRVQVTSRTLITDDDDDDRLVFADLRAGDFLEIDGIRREDAAGVYVEAVRIERDDDDDDEFELTGRVDGIGTASFSILGVTMNVDGGTEWDDGLEELEDLEVGMRVEVEYEQRNGLFYALEVEREDD